MPGFLGYIGTNINFRFCQDDRKQLIYNKLDGKNYKIERHTVNKFLHDKVWFDNDDVLIVTEGVILNRKQLEASYGVFDFTQCVMAMYKDLGECFFNSFRGSFSGLLYDKAKQVWIIFTDHIGDKQVFYSQAEQSILFGSEMGFMVETMKLNSRPITINKTGAYLLLTQGFVIEDHTLIVEVKKLTAGHYLRYDKKGMIEIQYHRFTNKPNVEMTVEEAIEGIDKWFQNAVKLQFEKDKEYGYKHLTCLSGGLDSRMTVWVAHKMGYTKQLNTTFSQSNYLDFSIAQQIATDLQHEFLFKTLDHGNFIKNVDDISKLTYGNTGFLGLAHGKCFYDIVNFKPYGIMHTGMIGDAIVATFFKKPIYNREVKLGQGANSLELIERLHDYKFKYEYENEEIFCLYTRAFTGANQGMLVFQEHTEAISPFCDVDFLEFCYSIPLLLRYNHKIYFDWILRKYPGAAEYVWEKKKKKIAPIVNKEPLFMTILGYKIPSIGDEHFLTWLKGSVLRRVGLRKKNEKPKTIISLKNYSMNPVDYWFDTNPSLNLFMTDYWNQYFNLIEDLNLLNDMNELYQKKAMVDKSQVLSLLSALKLIFN